ncbi:hypothetical protein C2G38_1290873 [Gigaspora rosea]|uniref:RRM domain-containing protein n=1 Tax=Gigaspora rosea TaxID=44941 RepID=A0A397VCN2_9GLOM|nr:hypothetical protein C2G38_1290873 [Gigaspora rosea]
MMMRKKVLSSSDIIENTINEEEEESSEVTATLFIKDINFNTTTKELNKVFKSNSGMKSAKIKMKNDPKNSGKKLSMGFGFVEYDNMKNAKNALKAMQGYMLDGHSLQLKFSNRGLDMVQRKRKDEITKKKKDSTKIIVKNVAFETTKKELKELFSAYGQFKEIQRLWLTQRTASDLINKLHVEKGELREVNRRLEQENQKLRSDLEYERRINRINKRTINSLHFQISNFERAIYRTELNEQGVRTIPKVRRQVHYTLRKKWMLNK